MRSFRHLAALSVLALPALLAFACGGGKPADDPSTASSASASASSDAVTSTAPSATESAAPSAVASASAAPSASSAPSDPCADVSAPFEAKVRPEVKKCFFAAMAKKPTLDGHVRVTVAIDTKGKPGNIVITDDKALGPEAVTCMKNAVKAGAFDGAACAGKSVVMNMAFGNAARN